MRFSLDVQNAKARKAVLDTAHDLELPDDWNGAGELLIILGRQVLLARLKRGLVLAQELSDSELDDGL
jgi:hypothetical protein